MDFPRDYPILSETVRRVYCIAARCTQSEREFSAVRRTVTDVRSSLAVTELLRWDLRAGMAPNE